MTIPTNPRRREDLIFREIEGEFIAYDPQADRTALLNETAAFTLDLCDGTLGREEISRRFAERFAIDRGAAAKDVGRALSEFADQGLLETEAPPKG